MGMRIKGTNFQQCEAGGSLAATSKMSEDACSIKLSPGFVEEIHSHSQEPVNLHQHGCHMEGKAALTGASMDELAMVMNATNSGGTVTVNATESTPKKLTKRDVSFDVALSGVDGVTTETWKITNVFFTGEVELNPKLGSKSFLPVNWRSSDESVLTVVQS